MSSSYNSIKHDEKDKFDVGTLRITNSGDLSQNRRAVMSAGGVSTERCEEDKGMDSSVCSDNNSRALYRKERIAMAQSLQRQREQRKLLNLKEAEEGEILTSNSNSVFSIDQSNKSKSSLHLMSEGKWKDLEEMLPLQAFSENFYERCSWCIKRHSLLHFACRYNPPLFIIKLLDESCPDAVHQTDCKNQFPLHIAVANEASTVVQSYLISRNMFAAKVPDFSGKTPLHLVFSDYKKRSKSGLDSRLNQTLLSSVKLISHAAPMSVFSQDNHGMTVLECAVSEHVGKKIQKELHKVASRMGSSPDVPIEKKKNSAQKRFDMVFSKIKSQKRKGGGGCAA